MDHETHAGWISFAGIMILITGFLNLIWGIAAIDKATFFVEEKRFIISDLKTWGWIIVIVAILQLFAAFSIFSGGGYGRFVGIVTAGLGMIGALLSIPGFPLWSLAIFFVDLLVVYALTVYGGHRGAETGARSARAGA